MATLSDLFAGLVAAGTLALAGVTYRLGRATSRSVQEAYRARIDESAHRVIVHSLVVAEKPLMERHVSAEYQAPASVDPGTPWDESHTGGQDLGLQATARVRNEGNVTTLVRIDCPSDVELFNRPSSQPLPAGMESLLADSGLMNGDWYLLTPGEDKPVQLIWWRPADRWRLSATESGVPTTSIKLAFKDATGSAMDECDLVFGAQVLWRNPTESAWFVAFHSLKQYVDNPPDPPVARIGPMVRSYPGEPPHRTWREMLRWKR